MTCTMSEYYIIMTDAINCNAHWPQITFKHKLDMYGLHDKNAYSGEKEPKRKKKSGEEMRRETMREKKTKK